MPINMFRRSVLSSDSGDSDEPEETKPIFTTIKSGDDDAVRQFIRENPNIVNLIGACTLEGDLNVILEYCVHGSLLMYLRARKENFVPKWMGDESTDITYTDLIYFAIGAANGMAFLESKKVQ